MNVFIHPSSLHPDPRSLPSCIHDCPSQAGVTRTLAVWNSYLGVYAVAGDIDRAYQIWTRMLAEGAFFRGKEAGPPGACGAAHSGNHSSSVPMPPSAPHPV